MHDLGVYPEVRAKTDSTAAQQGICKRRCLGTTRHVDVCYLWLQDKVAGMEVHIVKIPTDTNPADLMTNYLTGERTKTLKDEISIVQAGGRHELMPEFVVGEGGDPQWEEGWKATSAEGEEEVRSQADKVGCLIIWEAGDEKSIEDLEDIVVEGVKANIDCRLNSGSERVTSDRGDKERKVHKEEDNIAVAVGGQRRGTKNRRRRSNEGQGVHYDERRWRIPKGTARRGTRDEGRSAE